MKHQRILIWLIAAGIALTGAIVTSCATSDLGGGGYGYGGSPSAPC